jgi:hypothetical protein
MKGEVIARDTLRLLTYVECKKCEKAAAEISVGTTIRAAALDSGAVIEGELLGVTLKSSPAQSTGYVLRATPSRCVETVSLAGPIEVCCGQCKRTVGSVTLWT